MLKHEENKLYISFYNMYLNIHSKIKWIFMDIASHMLINKWRNNIFKTLTFHLEAMQTGSLLQYNDCLNFYLDFFFLQ